MSEKVMRGHVIRALESLDAKPVENPAWTGFPDVNYIEGLIELKHVKTWPKKPETPVQIPHFSREQRIFIDRRWRKGGNVYLLLQVGKTYLLYNGCDVQLIGRYMTQEQLRERAAHVWESLNTMKEGLPKCLDRSRTSPSP